MSETKFSFLITKLIKRYLKQTPSLQICFDLFQVVVPEFEYDDLFVKVRRERAWKQLQLIVHPDKNPEQDATETFQQLTNFRDSCKKLDFSNSSNPSNPSNSSNSSKPSNSSKNKMNDDNDNYQNKKDCYYHPNSFHVTDEWKFTSDVFTSCSDSYSICFNIHGHIWRYKLVLGSSKKLYKCSTNDFHVVEENIESLIEYMKKYGPIVNSKFYPSHENAMNYHKLVRYKCYEVVIVGWKFRSDIGHVWLVYVPDIKDEIQISFNDENILRNLKKPNFTQIGNCKWQDGVYIPVRRTDLKIQNDWMFCEKCIIYISAEQFIEILKERNISISKNSPEHNIVVIHDERMCIISRQAIINDIGYDHSNNNISLNLSFDVSK